MFKSRAIRHVMERGLLLILCLLLYACGADAGQANRADKPIQRAKPTSKSKAYTAANTLLGQGVGDFDGYARAFIIHPDGKTVVFGASDNTLQLWDLTTAKYLRTLTISGLSPSKRADTISAILYTRDGKELIAGTINGDIFVLDTQSGVVHKHLVDPDASILSLAQSSNGQLLATGGNNGSVKIWSLESGKLLHTLKGHTSDVYTVAFSSDDKILASGSNDNSGRLWDVVSGQLLHTLAGHTDSIDVITFNPVDGGTIATSSFDSTVKLWSSDGKLLNTFQGDAGKVGGLAFSPDGNLLASAHEDNVIKLWNPHSGKLQYTLTGLKSPPYIVQFLSNHQLASFSADQTLALWSI